MGTNGDLADHSFSANYWDRYEGYDLRRDGEPIYTSMYDGYAFEVIVQKDGHYPKDHDYPAVPHDAVLGDCCTGVGVCGCDGTGAD